MSGLLPPSSRPTSCCPRWRSRSCRRRCRQRCAPAIGRSRSFPCGWRRGSSPSPTAAANCACACTRTRSTSIRTRPISRPPSRSGACTTGPRCGAPATTRSAQATAWRQLADRFGAARAAWIVRALRPLNIGDRPWPRRAGRRSRRRRVFPPVTVVQRRQGRRVAARAAGAPAARPVGRHRAVGRPSGAGRHRPRYQAAAGGRTRSPGDDRRTTSLTIEAAVDAGMRWMIDFDAAEAAGMALRIPIPPEILAAGIDSLFVLGAAGSGNAAETVAASRSSCSTHTTTPTGWSSCAPARRRTTPPSNAPGTAPRIPVISAASPPMPR